MGFADIFMCKMEDDVAAPLKPIFYKWHVNYTYVRKKKNTKDELFEKLNTYHDNIKLTLKENPTKFLDTEIVRHNSAIILNFTHGLISFSFIGVVRFL